VGAAAVGDPDICESFRNSSTLAFGVTDYLHNKTTMLF
jgi:hypothetical protein